MSAHPRAVSGQSRLLLAIALAHYRQGMRDKLFRYKQLLVVVALLLFPTVGALYGFTVAPLRVLFAPAASLQAVVATLVCYQLVAMFLARVQRDAIFHEPSAPFMDSLPIGTAVRLLRDAAILLLSTIILFIPAAIAFVQHIAAGGVDLPSSLMMLYLVASATCAQMIYLHRWRLGGLALFASTLLVAWAAANGKTALGAVAGCLQALWAAHHLYFARGPGVGRRPGGARSGAGLRAASGARAGSSMGKIVRLNRDSLHHGKGNAYKLTLAVALMLATIAVAVIYAKGARPLQVSVAGTACTLAAVMVFLSSMSYATVLAGRRPYQGMFASLPVSAAQWAMLDVVSVQAVPLQLAVLVTALWCWHAAPGWLAPLPMATVVVLGTINYFIYRLAPRHAIALSLLALIAGLLAATMAASLIGGVW